jgi:hypothetical protein
LTCLQTPHCTALHVRGSGLSYSYLGRRLLAQASRARTVQCRHADDARARAGGRAAHVDRPGLVSSWPVAATGDLRLASARGQLFDPRDPGRGRRPCASRDIILPRKGESDGCPGSTASRVGGASVCTDAGWEGAATATATRATLTPGPERSGGWYQPAAS